MSIFHTICSVYFFAVRLVFYCMYTTYVAHVCVYVGNIDEVFILGHLVCKVDRIVIPWSYFAKLSQAPTPAPAGWLSLALFSFTPPTRPSGIVVK